MITPITLFARFTRRTWSGRAALLVSVPLAAAAMLAAGCGTVSTPPSGGGAGDHPTTTGSPTSASPVPTTASPVPTTTGGSVTPGQPACAGWPANAARGPLPASFVPVAAIRCVSNYQTIAGKGQWLTATLERADKNLAPLTAALRLPSVRTRAGIMCPQIAMVPPEVVLTSSDGKTLMPWLPLRGCGMVREEVLGALSALPWQKVSVRLVSQVQTQPEVTSGCTPGYRDPFITYGSLRPSPGGSLFSAPPSSLRICVYSSGGATSTAQFVRAATVTGSTESALIAGLSGAGHASLCTLPHLTFAVIQGSGSPLIYVELGGCHRVFRYETEAGGLMGLSIGQATPGAVAIIESVTHPKP